METRQNNMTKYILLALVLVLVGCDTSSSPTAAQATVAEVPTADQAMDAMVRSHSNAEQICHDRTHNAYFIYYGPDLPVGVPNDGQWHGWMYNKNIKFYKVENDTWFTAESDLGSYIHVYPDITGLVCKLTEEVK